MIFLSDLRIKKNQDDWETENQSLDEAQLQLTKNNLNQLEVKNKWNSIKKVKAYLNNLGEQFTHNTDNQATIKKRQSKKRNASEAFGENSISEENEMTVSNLSEENELQRLALSDIYSSDYRYNQEWID